MNLVSINLSKEEQLVVLSSLNEFRGGSWETMDKISGYTDEEAAALEQAFNAARAGGNGEIALEEWQWRFVYNSINATLYALGPSELETVTDFGPIQLLQANLTICSKVWGASGYAKWTERYHVVRVAHTTLHS